MSSTETEEGQSVKVAGDVRGTNRDMSFDLQMRLTRRPPSASLPLRQAKNNGSTPEAQQKSCVRQGIRRGRGKRLRAAQGGRDLQYDNETG